MIRYTIIIPHYNIPDLLVRCVNSIPDREDIRVIVVDDNSPDSDSYLERFPSLKRGNVELVLTHEGRGAGYARNVGLSKAKGTWLIFADADDFFPSNFTQILDEYYSSVEDIIYFNVHSCMCDNPTIESNRNKDILFDRFADEKDETVFRFGYAEPWGKIVRRELVEKNCIKFDETKLSNDYLFSMKTGYYAKKIKIENRQFYVYTDRQGSLSYNDEKVHLDRLEARLGAFMNVQLFMQDKGYKSSPALTSFILVPLFKHHNDIYRKYIKIFYSRKLSVRDLLRDTLMHYVYKLVGKKLQMGDANVINWVKS